MNPLGHQPPPANGAGATAGDGTEQPAPPAQPARVSIQTSPLPPSATPSAPGTWLQDQPYGASPNAPYAVAAAPRGFKWKRLLIATLVLALLAGGAAVLFRDRLFPQADGPAHPSEWDPRVATLAEFVSTERELEWVHPVHVEFLPEAEFVVLFDQPDTPRGEEADALARLYSQLYDAFGLAVGYDPTQGQSAVSAVTTLGFYSLDSDRVYVRGDQLTPAVQVVLAHELTHALQAQHFDLAIGAGDGDDLELRAVVEADALRVEEVFLATLSPADKAAAVQANALGPDAAAGLVDVPWAVVEQRYAPYVLGPMLVNDVFAKQGNAGVDQLILEPPTEEILMNPWMHGDPVQPDTAVMVEVPLGTTVLDPPQSLSQVDLLVMLDAWLPWSQARRSLDGWAGGTYTSYDRDGVVCFTASASFDNSADRFAVAVTAWAQAAGSAANPSVIVNDVTFEACARGAAATEPPVPVVSPLRALQLEHDAIGLAGPNPSPDQIQDYQCFAGTMIDDPLLAPLLVAETLDTDEQALYTWQSTIAANECGVPPP